VIGVGCIALIEQGRQNSREAPLLVLCGILFWPLVASFGPALLYLNGAASDYVTFVMATLGGRETGGRKLLIMVTGALGSILVILLVDLLSRLVFGVWPSDVDLLSMVGDRMWFYVTTPIIAVAGGMGSALGQELWLHASGRPA